MNSKSSQNDKKVQRRNQKKRKTQETASFKWFGGKSNRSSKLYAFQGGPRAEGTRPGGGNAWGSGAYYPLRQQTAAIRQHATDER